jgi:release factor glutamine methyltransferase
VEFDPQISIAEDPRVYRPAEDSLLFLRSVRVDAGERFLEVGAGSGLLALHAARRGRAVATDTNPEAVRLARANARLNNLSLELVRTDLMAGLRGPFDVIAFNPPYLEGRPGDDLDRAWHGGRGGSEVSVRFLGDLRRILAPGGRAYLLLSQVNEVAKQATEPFEVRVVSSQRLFFEELEVLELTLRDSSGASPTSRSSGRSRASSGQQGPAQDSSR